MDNRSGEPRVVDAGRGAAWWAGGWRLFASNVFTWIGIIIVYYVISIVLNIVPVIGSVAQALLTPVFVGGIMLGCRSIERDGTLRVAHLFEGFQSVHFVQLMIIGAVNIGFFVALFLLGALGVFGTVGLAALANPGVDPTDAFASVLTAMPGSALLVALLMLVLVAVFAMLNWFAPAQVALRGASAWEAMKRSLSACLRNWLPFLVYGLIALAVMTVFGLMIVAGAFAFFASAFTGSDMGLGTMMFGFIMLGILFALSGFVIGPIVFGSAYASYVDVFDGANESLANPAYR